MAHNARSPTAGRARSSSLGPQRVPTVQAVHHHLQAVLSHLQAFSQDSPGAHPTVRQAAETSARQLEQIHRDSTKNFYNAVSPIMVDSLLRYIANSNYPGAVVNPSIHPAEPKKGLFHHYPSVEEIEREVANRQLTRQLGTTLIKALQNSFIKPRSDNDGRKEFWAIANRNSAAHPTGLNHRFEKNARVLDQYEPGWLQAYKNFVATPKAVAEDRLAHDFYNKLEAEGEPWDPVEYHANGAPRSQRALDRSTRQAHLLEQTRQFHSTPRPVPVPPGQQPTRTPYAELTTIRALPGQQKYNGYGDMMANR
ncbi:hypothetical protein JCM8547_000091 [Rhodosporidiobolus lusitaniae]